MLSSSGILKEIMDTRKPAECHAEIRLFQDFLDDPDAPKDVPDPYYVRMIRLSIKLNIFYHSFTFDASNFITSYYQESITAIPSFMNVPMLLTTIRLIIQGGDLLTEKAYQHIRSGLNNLIEYIEYSSSAQYEH